MGVDASVDCDLGRRLGCKTFCCHLLVRLGTGETTPSADCSPSLRFVDKAPDGCCVHLGRDTQLCSIWECRPSVCRGYDCNGDFLLQVVLREGFKNIAQSAQAAARAYIPKETYIVIPARRDE